MVLLLTDDVNNTETLVTDSNNNNSNSNIYSSVPP